MAVRFLKLASLQIGRALSDADGKPTKEFVRYFNDMINNIESAANNLATQQNDIITALNNAGIAITTANNAATTANTTKREAALVQSYVDPGAILSAIISPADSTKTKITIAAHTRKYGDGTSVSVAGASIDLLAVESYYYIYYDDTTRAGGTVSYQASLNYLNAAQMGNRHSVGGILTPALGGSGTNGGGTRPPGTGGIRPGEQIP